MVSSLPASVGVDRFVLVDFGQGHSDFDGGFAGTEVESPLLTIEGKRADSTRNLIARNLKIKNFLP
jgi:hypothetical protein